MGVIMFNGVSSADYGIWVETLPNYAYPEREYTVTHVPGRNGDVYAETGCYQNVDVSYNVAVQVYHENFMEYAASIRRWLHTPAGYCRLEDDYDPDHYRMAVFKDSGTVSNILNGAGRAAITFQCKPQRFRKDGEAWQNVQNGGKLYNPTVFEAKPLLHLRTISSTASITIDGTTISIKLSDLNKGEVIAPIVTSLSELYIDCDAMAAWMLANGAKKSANSALSGKFPVIGQESTVTFSGIGSVEIQPRWWEL